MEYSSEVKNSLDLNPFLFFSYDRQKRSKRQQLIMSAEEHPKIESINVRKSRRREKFFPKDFFGSSSKPDNSKKRRQIIHSAARKDAVSLNREIGKHEYQEHKNLGLNPFKMQSNCSETNEISFIFK